MVLVDFVKVLFVPRPIMEKRLFQERFFSMIVLLSLLSVILAVVSVSFFRAEDMTEASGVTIDSDTYEAYKVFMLLGTGFMASFTPIVFILFNTLINKLILWAVRVTIPFRGLFILGILAHIPLLMDTLVRIIVQSFIGEPLTKSPAALFSFLFDSESQLGGMLSVFTVFGVWSTLLYATGIYILAPERARWRSIIVVVLVWIITTFVSGYINNSLGPIGK
ncbi:hypothetical protein [Paenibacillus arenilitoris]|uniref:Yip1 domain-containing protein n=1 Tax=Paenibacillus arenilitoris TaxID=2772299 RepID=A0A927CJI2_9BACL|nr:hypothetical protein [Paenibacillus arenilitoris]MBD2867041.1 hypothetical protein [Paenibacillus arenilitoris]